MTPDPAFHCMLSQPDQVFMPPRPGESLELRRQATRLLLDAPRGAALHSVTQFAVSGPARPIQVRLYRPIEANLLPIIMFFHGGGWVFCDLDSHDAICRDLAHLTRYRRRLRHCVDARVCDRPSASARHDAVVLELLHARGKGSIQSFGIGPARNGPQTTSLRDRDYCRV